MNQTETIAKALLSVPEFQALAAQVAAHREKKKAEKRRQAMLEWSESANKAKMDLELALFNCIGFPNLIKEERVALVQEGQSGDYHLCN